MDRLKDKVVLITGAAGSVGRAVAQAAGAQGAIVVTTDLASRQDTSYALDVTSEPDWLRVIAEVGREYERLDGLVNAAGLAALGNIEETDFATWRKILAVNLDGTFLGCKHGLALLKRRGGAIVNVSSVAGLVGGHNFAAYNASKGGVRLLTKSVALHGARLEPKVRCNSIHPAFLEGPMVDTSCSRRSFRTRRARGWCGTFRSGGSARRPRSPICVFTCSPMNSRFVTGAEFVIDGGLTAR